MNPQILIGAICLAVFFVLFLTAWVLFFRLSCRLCQLEKPSVLLSLGIVILTFLIGFIVEALLTAFVRFVYSRSNLPMWESGVTAFFFGLPVDMVINAAIHAALMKLSMGKGIEVWFVQRMMLLAVFVPLGFLAGLAIFLTR